MTVPSHFLAHLLDVGCSCSSDGFATAMTFLYGASLRIALQSSIDQFTDDFQGPDDLARPLSNTTQFNNCMTLLFGIGTLTFSCSKESWGESV